LLLFAWWLVMLLFLVRKFQYSKWQVRVFAPWLQEEQDEHGHGKWGGGNKRARVTSG
jgi:hypothetical protein